MKIKDVDRFMSDKNKKGKETLTSGKYISYYITFWHPWYAILWLEKVQNGSKTYPYKSKMKN